MNEIELGSYVLATKYSDGDPGDPWAVGFLLEKKKYPHETRYIVGDNDGHSFRYGGYRYVRRISFGLGAKLLSVADELESSPPGTIDLWQMISGEKEGYGNA